MVWFNIKENLTWRDEFESVISFDYFDVCLEDSFFCFCEERKHLINYSWDTNFYISSVVMVDNLKLFESWESLNRYCERHRVEFLMMHEILDFSHWVGKVRMQRLRRKMVRRKRVVHQLCTSNKWSDSF